MDTLAKLLLVLFPAVVLLGLIFVFRPPYSGRGAFVGLGFDLNIAGLAMVMSITLQAFSSTQDTQIIDFFVFAVEFITLGGIGRLMAKKKHAYANAVGFAAILPAFLWVIHVVLISSIP